MSTYTRRTKDQLAARVFECPDERLKLALLIRSELEAAESAEGFIGNLCRAVFGELQENAPVFLVSR